MHVAITLYAHKRSVQALGQRVPRRLRIFYTFSSCIPNETYAHASAKSRKIWAEGNVGLGSEPKPMQESRRCRSQNAEATHAQSG
eukprot:806045-Pelagomonas_calceolata.AAC.6